jgi:hypothetical protein
MEPELFEVVSQTTTEPRFAPNSVVGARRWPKCLLHPDCWERPLQGTVLAIDDPRAWAGTTAFPSDEPNPLAVRNHVLKCRERGTLGGDLPVLWVTDKGPVVRWQSTFGLHCLKTYDEDLNEWFMERARACANIRRVFGGAALGMAA